MMTRSMVLDEQTLEVTINEMEDAGWQVRSATVLVWKGPETMKSAKAVLVVFERER